MRCAFVAVLAILLVASSAFAEPTVWYVHPDSALNSIQAALDSCADNDIVLVAPGTYYENIVWPATQGIQLISSMGAEHTIIDGDSAGSVISMLESVDSTTILNGFTIQNGYCTYGGGMLVSMGSPTVCNNIIVGNGAYYAGGGIHCMANSSSIIRNNTVSNNYAGDGGGITCHGGSPTITGNTITDNTAGTLTLQGKGGGIYIWSASGIIASNTISDNKTLGPGGQGAGIICDHASPDIIGNLITSNIPSNYAGGIECYYSSPNIHKNTITYNSGTYGAGICCTDSSTPMIDSCIIAYNGGHGVYCHINGAVPVLHYNDIIDNQNYGVMNSSSTDTVDATYNWWGHSSGPGGVGPGTGDEVSDYVFYDPWLNAPVGITEDDNWELGTRKWELVATPNPFSSATTILLSGMGLGAEGMEIDIYDVAGRRVRTFFPYASSFILPASLEWDGKDSNGQAVMPGVYFVRCTAGSKSLVEKIIRLK